MPIAASIFTARSHASPPIGWPARASSTVGGSLRSAWRLEERRASIILGPAYGVESTSVATLFNASSLLWSLGVSIAQPLIDSGRIRANVDLARGGYDLALANYRRLVLTAMQEAEDGITGMAALERASAQAGAAIVSAQRVLELANARYEGGIATYLDVITAQQSLLNSERLAAQLRGQRMLTAVFLVKALGGDWPGASSLAAASTRSGTPSVASGGASAASH